MSLIKKESIGTSIIFFIGVVLGYVNLIFIYPYCLSLEQIGLLKLLLSLSTFFASFVPLGGPNITIKYYPIFNKSDEDKKNFLGYLLILPAIGYALFLALFFIFKENLLAIYSDESPLIVDYVIQLLLLIIFISYYRVFLGYSSSNFKTVFPAFLKEAYLRLIIPIALFAYFSNWVSFELAINLIVGFYFSVTMLLVLYLMIQKNFRFKFSKSFYQNSKSQLELFKYGSFVMLSNSGQIIVQNLDIMMVGAFLGLADTGIYSVVYIIGQVVEIPKRAISRISAAVIAKKWEENKLDDIQNIYQKTSLTNILLGGFIFIGIWVSLPDLFSLMPQGDSFKSGIYVVLFISMSKLFSMLMGNNGEILMTSKYYWFTFIATLVLSVATFISNYLLIPIYGINGAAFATLLSVIAFNLALSGFLYWQFKFSPLSFNTLKAIGFLAIVLAFGMYLPNLENPIISIGYKSILISVLFAAGVYFLPISADLKMLIQEKIKKYI